MTALYIMAVIVFLAVLLLLSDVRLKINYVDDFSVSVGFLVYKKTLYPQKEDKPKKSKKSAEKQAEREKIKSEKPSIWTKLVEEHGISGALSIVIETVKILLERFHVLLSHIRVKPFQLKAAISTGDAATTAIEYGAVSAILFPFLGYAAGMMNFKSYDVDISPDFENGKNSIYFRCVLRVKLFYVVVAVFKALLGYIKKVYSRTKQAKV